MKLLGLAAAAAVLIASSAHAIVLTPGPGTFAPDVFAFPSGSVVASITDAPFVSGLGASDFSGTYSTEVIQGPNSFGADDLTFVYSFNIAAGSGQDVNRVTGSSFAGFQTDVGYVAGSGDIPNSVDRTTASPVGWNFIDGVAAGASSVVLEVQTDAATWTAGNFSLINDGTSTNAAFAPNVPEVPTWAMMLLGFGLLAFGTARGSRFRQAL